MYLHMILVFGAAFSVLNVHCNNGNNYSKELCVQCCENYRNDINVEQCMIQKCGYKCRKSQCRKQCQMVKNKSERRRCRQSCVRNLEEFAPTKLTTLTTSTDDTQSVFTATNEVRVTSAPTTTRKGGYQRILSLACKVEVVLVGKKFKLEQWW